MNIDPVTQCIHSGDEAVSIQKQMAIWHEAGELAYVVDEAGNSDLGGSGIRFLSTIGGEFDEEAGRCWLWGRWMKCGCRWLLWTTSWCCFAVLVLGIKTEKKMKFRGHKYAISSSRDHYAKRKQLCPPKIKAFSLPFY